LAQSGLKKTAGPRGPMSLSGCCTSHLGYRLGSGISHFSFFRVSRGTLFLRCHARQKD
jgi:hypothetical protein